jgi:hypothetical protein
MTRSNNLSSAATSGPPMLATPAAFRLLRGLPQRTDEELLEVAARACAMSAAAIARLEQPAELLDLRAGVTALCVGIASLIRSRKAQLAAANLLTESRLRIERALGGWLATNVNHSGGGDRRSVSHAATPIRDLPEGMTRSMSSRFQQIARVPQVVFDRYIQRARDTAGEVSTAGCLKFAKLHERTARHDERLPGTTNGCPAAVEP